MSRKRGELIFFILTAITFLALLQALRTKDLRIAVTFLGVWALLTIGRGAWGLWVLVRRGSEGE